MAQIILDSNNNLIQGDFDNATLNNRTKLQTTTTNATTNVYVVPNGSSTSAGVSVANNSSLTNASKIVMATNGTTDTQIISGVNGSGTYLPLNFYTNNALSMTIDTANNVGIGTSGPITKLSLSGAMYVPASNFKAVLDINSTNSQATGNGAGITLGGVFTGTTQTAFAQIAGIKENSTDGNYAGALAMYYRPNGNTLAEGMRIDSSGSLLVGTTTAQSGFRMVLQHGNSGNDAGLATVTTTTSAVNAISFQNPNGQIGRVQVNLTTTTYVTSSDYRLKENIVPMTGALDKVSKLKPVTYTWKTDGTSGQGFIAHELQEFYPEAVAGTKDEVDAEGNPVHQGVDTSFLVATLTAAIQEQQTIINELKTRIEALESK